MPPSRKYEVKPGVTEEIAGKLGAYSLLIQQLLVNRGITEGDAADRFLNPDYDTDLHSPFLLTDMHKAVERVLRALRENEHIVIYTDYDCDGIPGGVLLHDFFTAIAYTNFENYIPHRHDEGYGFNADSVPKFKERGATLIITVDCGITDHAAVAAANALGIDVIVTDHHEPSETLPEAFAVINPKRDNAYPFQGICGTVVAYKLVQAILEEGKKNGQITLKDGMEKWWLDLVGIATVADMVPLVDENRTLARYGLSVLRKSQRPGLQHLLRKAGGSQKHLTEDDIGFTIGPRINAASRMDDPEDAFHMLRTRDEVEAGMHVAHLEKLNNERKGVVASMTKEAKKRMSTLDSLPSVIVMGNPEWRPSLVGLVANGLAEEFNRPAFLWGKDGKGIIKGSCRSEGVTSIVRLMEGASTSFLTFGGHHASGGFSVSHESIHTLPEALISAQAILNTSGEVQREILQADAEITLGEITEELIRSLDSLSPFGMGNPKPLFAIRDVSPQEVVIFGKTQNHTKLKLTSGRDRYDAICFFKLPTEFTVVPEKEKLCTLLAHIERSFFMGRLETRLRIIDIV
ncbi:MAG: single-stranded-DNA-specific exonuclease RecJ [Minisyncoccia bacterium]